MRDRPNFFGPSLPRPYLYRPNGVPNMPLSWMRVRGGAPPLANSSAVLNPRLLSGCSDWPRRSWENHISKMRGCFNWNPRSSSATSQAVEKLKCRSSHRSALYRSNHELDSVQTFSQSVLSSHYYRPLQQIALEIKKKKLCDELILHLLHHNNQSQKCLATTRSDCCLAVPQMPQLNDASTVFDDFFCCCNAFVFAMIARLQVNMINHSCDLLLALRFAFFGRADD